MLSVCSIESSATFDEMSNVVRAIVINADNFGVQKNANAARLLYILNNDEDIPSDIKSLINKAHKITIVVSDNDNTFQCLKGTEITVPQNVICGETKQGGVDAHFATSALQSSLRQRAGPTC